MKDKHIIKVNTNIIEVMQRLNEVPKSLTLFVVNEQDVMIGTLTDGDIRRGFVKGLQLSDSVDKFLADEFHFMFVDEISLIELKKIRKKGISLLPILSKDKKIVKIVDLKKFRSLLPVDCMIMAGGKGERLRPLTDNTPKPLLKVGDKPIIEHNIDRLIEFGVEHIYISVKYLGEQIQNYLGDGSAKGIKIDYIWEENPLGTAGALSLVDKFDKDYILLMNSDIFSDINFEELFLAVLDQDADMGIASIPYHVNIPYAILESNNNQVSSFVEKPKNTHYANAGIYIFKKEYVKWIPNNTFFHITHLFDKLLEHGKKVIHEPIVGYWIDIGSLKDYENANEIVKHLNN